MMNNKIWPVINEKSINSLVLDSEYTLDVCMNLSKGEIKSLVENTFQSKVEKVTTQIQPKKRKSARLGGGVKKSTRLKRVRITFKEPAPIITQYWAAAD
jgi:ribosomal protein L23